MRRSAFAWWWGLAVALAVAPLAAQSSGGSAGGGGAPSGAAGGDLDGTYPNPTVVGGAADTAAALAANGANCNAGNYPLGVDASGAVETCTSATSGIAQLTVDNLRLDGQRLSTTSSFMELIPFAGETIYFTGSTGGWAMASDGNLSPNGGSGLISVGAGNVSSPALSNSGDGVYFPAADEVGLAAGGAGAAKIDASATATHTRFFLYDVDNATLERVTVDGPDTCGSGFKCLRIPN